jgi:hypothetical protein
VESRHDSLRGPGDDWNEKTPISDEYKETFL